MASLLLSIIYVAFISLGLPDSLLGAAWPSMYGGACLMQPFFGVLADHLSPALFPFYLLVLLGVMAAAHEALVKACGGRAGR